jgi:hypothetical protein
VYIKQTVFWPSKEESQVLWWKKKRRDKSFCFWFAVLKLQPCFLFYELFLCNPIYLLFFHQIFNHHVLFTSTEPTHFLYYFFNLFLPTKSAKQKLTLTVSIIMGFVCSFLSYCFLVLDQQIVLFWQINSYIVFP